MDKASPIIIALDFANEKQALSLVEQLDPAQCRVKIGKQLFTGCGPTLVKKLVAMDFDVFLDLKFHDIPNTVANACRSAAELGVWMLNVHALGGSEMMHAAKNALTDIENPPLLIAVTLLTSLAAEDLLEIGIPSTPEKMVLRLAQLAAQQGLDGVVCSAKEVAILRDEFDSTFNLVTPGIRPSGTNHADQKRVMTPADALLAGSTYLVIGRAITQAEKPADALAAIIASIHSSQQLV